MNGAVFLTLIAALKLISASIDHNELKCLVCKSTVNEIEAIMNEMDPNVHVDAGGYRLDEKGDIHKKTLPQTRSEVHLSEVLDTICEKMDDYIRGTKKTNGELTILKIMTPSGGMNPEMSEVDIIQDDDLNKSVKYNCELILEEQEDDLVKHFIQGLDNIDIRFCSLHAKYCSDTLPEEDYQREEL